MIDAGGYNDEDAPEYAYIGVKSCGCTAAIIMDIPDTAEDLAATLREIINDGCHIERVTIEELKIRQKCCYCRSPHAYVCIKPCGCIEDYIEDCPENKEKILDDLDKYLSHGYHIERMPSFEVEIRSCRICADKDSVQYQSSMALKTGRKPFSWKELF